MRPAKSPSFRGLFLLQAILFLGVCVSIANSQTEITLHEFTNGVDGGLPLGGLISDGQGNFFGVTYGEQGLGAFGTVFELSPTNGGGWNLTTLYTFQGGVDGTGPVATLVRDQAGNLYGMTRTGGNGTSSYCDIGTGQFGCGTVFEISPDGNGGWKKTTLYQFQGIVGARGRDGLFPSGPLVLDAVGNLYGTTANGGINIEGYGGGTVFELSPTATGWKEKMLVSLGGVGGGPAGAAPEGGVIFDSAGNLYGTTANGGSNNSYCQPEGCGAAFKMSPKSGGGWSVTPIHTFIGTDGAYPGYPLVFDSAGNLYGVARGGTKGGGVVFKLEPGSAGWKDTVLLQFYGANGSGPEQLVFGDSGNLYGATAVGGKFCSVGNTCGEVFKLSPSGSGAWLQSVLYRFNGAADGAYPNAPLIFDSTGNLYGVASQGGTFGFGTVFEIVP